MEKSINVSEIFKEDLCVKPLRGLVRMCDPDSRTVAIICSDYSKEHQLAMAQRIVDCINAFRKIQNPKLFMEYHEQIINNFFQLQSDIIKMKRNEINPYQKLPTLKPTNNLTNNNEYEKNK